MRGLTIFIVLLAGVGALLGLLFGHSTVGVGWGMCIAGALASFVVGGSGSPSDNLVRGRVGAFGTYWGQSAPLPQSPIWMLFASLLVFAGGIGVVVLGYSH